MSRRSSGTQPGRRRAQQRARSRKEQAFEPLDVARVSGQVGRREQDYRGQEFMVREVSASAAQKNYRCPGCHRDIAPAVAHVVAWPADHPAGVEQRRHWHRTCWAQQRRTGGSWG